MTAIAAATAPQLASVRAKKQACAIYAVAIIPPIIFAAQINGTPTTHDMLKAITFDNVTTGAYTDVVANQDVWIGSAPGLSDIGVVRAISVTSTILTIGEESEVGIQDGQYISAVKSFSLWARHLGVDSDGTAYMDGNIAYDDQHTNFTGLVIMGTHAVKELTGPSVSSMWKASDSWCPNATITNCTWTCPGGTIDDATSATPNISFNATGQYLVTCSITFSNGKTATGRRWAYIYAKRDAYAAGKATVSRARSANVATLVTAAHGLSNGDVIKIHSLADNTYNLVNVVVSVVNGTTFTYPCPGADETTTADTGGFIFERVAVASLPSKVQLNSCSLDYQRGGVEFAVRMYTGATGTDIHDRALCILFTEDWYDGVKGSVGQIPDRENVLAVGWINGETITANKDGGYVEFTASGPHFWLGIEMSYPLGIENLTGTPAAWTSMLSPIIDHFLAHYAVWRSTLAEVCDVYPNGDTRISPAAKASTGTIWSQITAFTEEQILAHPCSDQFGRVFCEVDSQYVPLTDRASIPEIMSLQSSEITGDVNFGRIVTKPVSRVELNGVSMSDAFFSFSPGHVYRRFGNPEPVDKLLLSSQEQSNSLAGLVSGQRNNQYPQIEIEISENNRLIGVCPNQYLVVSISATKNARGIAYNGRVIPRSVSWSTRSGSLTVSLTCEAETFEDLSTNGDIPVPPLPPYVIPPIPPLPPLPPVPPLPDPPMPPPLGIVAILAPPYGLFFCDFTDVVDSTSVNWYSANAPFTTTQKEALAYMTLARDGTAYVATNKEVYSTVLMSNMMTVLRTELQFMVDFGEHGYDIRALGMNYSIGQGLGVIAGRAYPFALTATYLLSGTGLIRKYYGGWDIYPGATWITNYAGRWFTTTLDGILATRVLRAWDGSFVTPNAGAVVGGSPYAIPHVHARSADLIFIMNGPLYIYDNFGSHLLATKANAANVDCDPAGMVILQLAQNYAGISTDQGDNWTDLTANLPFTPHYNGLVLNMGNALSWFISFNDEAGYLRVCVTSDGGDTWMDAIGNLHSMSDPNAGVTVSKYA